jgi:tRNA A37 threonylcarbamoyladenosine dehydratase
MLAQFTRTNILLGEDNLTKLAGKHILIAGVGGVGGYVLSLIHI